MRTCLYLCPPGVARETEDGRPVKGCHLFRNCVESRGADVGLACCETCRDFVSIEQAAELYKDPLRIVDSLRAPTTALRDLLRRGVAFLVCGGPSAKSLDLSRMRQRGIWSMAVNNMAGYFHPSAFICADPPEKFHQGIWLDPTIMKFIPDAKMASHRDKLKEKNPDGSFSPLMRNGKEVTGRICPNVWGFNRRSWLKPDKTFFTEDSAAWGNHDDGVLQTGEPKTVGTILLGLRLLYYLGARTIYLVGVDFGMSDDKRYAFDQERSEGAIQSNNDQFQVMSDWLHRLEDGGIFRAFGLKVYNCNQQSELRAFEHRSYDQAISHALETFPLEPFDLAGWY